MTPRLILEVRGGKSHGTKAVVDPGAKIRVGRTDLADVVIPHDPLMNGVHFELAWDGARAFVQDRRTMKGTQVGGLPISKSEVPHGGWIRAGNTDFMVYVEAKTPPRPEEAEEETAPDPFEQRERETRRIASEKALIDLRAEAVREPLFAIVDAARDERILQILRESVEKHQSLYEGVDGEALEDVAPYLVGPMRADSTCLDRLVSEGWGRRWGIFVTSRESFKEVRRHFRRFLMVEIEGYERGYFRFPDPWVFQNFWEVAADVHREALAGAALALFAEPAWIVRRQPAESQKVRSVRVSRNYLAALDRALDAHWARGFARKLVREVPSGTSSDAAEATEFVQREMAAAERYGIVTEYARENYVTASWLIGGSVDELVPEVRPILAKQGASESYRAFSTLELVRAQREASRG